MIRIAPSILSCDFARLGEEAAAIAAAGGQVLHVDVMDGHFVPNISLGVPVVQSLRRATDLTLDVHLMISNPLAYVEAFAKAGSDIITFHIESDSNTAQTIRRIRELGVRPGLVISPDTAVDRLLPYLPLVDLVLVMTVRPGFGGQSFMEDMMPKLDAVKAACREQNLQVELEVDGGINSHTAQVAAAHGATLLVAGSAVFGKEDYGQAMESILDAAKQGAAR